MVGRGIPHRGSSCASLGNERGFHVQGWEHALKLGKGAGAHLEKPYVSWEGFGFYP